MKYFGINDSEEFTRTEYLYGHNRLLIKIPKYVISYNLYMLNRHLTKILKPHYMVRDYARVKSIQDEISFWEKIKGTQYERTTNSRRRWFRRIKSIFKR